MSDQSDLEQFASADSGSERQPAEYESEDSEPEEHGTARFPSLPTDWEIKRLDEVATVQGGSTPSTDEDEYWSGDIPWATPTDLTVLQGNTVSDTEDKITEAGLESTSTHVLPPYSVLLTSRASIGKCAVNTVPMATNQGFQSLIPGEGVNTWYLYYVTTEMAPYLKSLGAGSTFSEISKREVQRVQIPVPPMEEQLRIATALYTIEETASQAKKRANHAERVRKGILYTIFGEEKGVLDNETAYNSVRLGSKSFTVPGHWEVRSLGSLGEIVTGDTPSTNNDEYYGGDLPFVTPEDFGDSKRVNKGRRGLTKAGREKSRPIPEGSVMVDCIGMDMGKVRIAGTEITTNQQINVVIPDEEIVSSVFLYYQLEALSELLKAQAGQTRTPIVNKSQFSSFEVLVPPLEEQQEIVDLLDSHYNLSTTESRIVENTSTILSGLLRELISGERRLENGNIKIIEEVCING
jgi:type I restriction enzyme S subunit